MTRMASLKGANFSASAAARSDTTRIGLNFPSGVISSETRLSSRNVPACFRVSRVASLAAWKLFLAK